MVDKWDGHSIENNSIDILVDKSLVDCIYSCKSDVDEEKNVEADKALLKLVGEM